MEDLAIRQAFAALDRTKGWGCFDYFKAGYVAARAATESPALFTAALVGDLRAKLVAAQAELEAAKAELERRAQADPLLATALGAALGFAADSYGDEGGRAAIELLEAALKEMESFKHQSLSVQGCGACGDACKGKQCRVKEESPPVDLTHAYDGAREDLAIWKRRALEAEAKLREVEQHKPRPTGLSEGWNRVRQADGFVVAHSSLEPEPRHKEQALADGYVYVPFLVSDADKLEMVSQWRPMGQAPKDGTIVRLLVEFDDNSTEDQIEPAPTIGCNNFDNDEQDEWSIAGWSWSHDCFTAGYGKPIGWLPMLDSQQAEVKS